MKCINMLINLNEEKEEDVVDDKEKEEVNSATYVLSLFECLSCVCLILIIIIFFSFLFLCVCVHSLRSFQICKFRPLLLYTNCCYRC